jgi:hypothetical protein
MLCALKIHASINVARCSPLRVRVVPDWHPCHPARLQLDIHVSLSQFSSFLICANVPSDSTGEHFEPHWLSNFKLLTSNFPRRILLRHCGDFVSPPLSSNIIDNETILTLQAESIRKFTQVPPDLKRYYFGHVHCPAVSG